MDATEQRLQFEQRWLEYYNAVFSFVFHSLKNRADAEDVTQTTLMRFLAFMERRHWELEVVNVKAYLLTIAKRLCYEFWTRRRKEGAVSYDDEHDKQTQKDLERKSKESDDLIRKIEDHIYYEELIQSLPLDVILDGLSEEELDLLYLDVVEGLSNEEIAEIVGEDVDSVRYHLQKLHAKIRYRGRKYLERTGGKLF